MPGKSSQSLQLNASSAQALVEIIEATFPSARAAIGATQAELTAWGRQRLDTIDDIGLH